MRNYIVIDPLEVGRFVRPSSPLANEVLAGFYEFSPVWALVPRRKDRWARDLSPRLRDYVREQLS